jgi:hypothetical protein
MQQYGVTSESELRRRLQGQNSGQFTGNQLTNPQMQQAQNPSNAGQAGWWNQLATQQFAGGPQQVQGMNIGTPKMSSDWEKYLKGMMSTNPLTAQNVQAQNVQAQNVTAPQMSQDYLRYLNAGTQAINAGAMQDTSALLKSYDPLLQRQQEQGFAGAASRAGKTGMWGSPYAGALGREAATASSQRANIANQYLYQASEAQANRQLQAEVQNRQNQLQAAGLSAQQARAQAEMELSASQGNQGAGLQAGMANQQAGLQAGMANQQANLQAQIQGRAQQLQAAGLSADQAYRQAQLEQQSNMANQQTGLQAGMANQQAGLQYGNQVLAGQQQAQQQQQNMLDRFLQQYGDIASPDDLWGYLSNQYNTGGQFGALPQTPATAQPNYGGTQFPNYYQQYQFAR